MPVVISGIRTRLDESEEAAVEKALHKAGMTANQVTQAFVVKRSVDARKQREISWVSSVQFTIHGNEEKLAARLANKFGDNRIKLWKEKPLAFEFGVKKLEHPVAIAGFGPAGIFAALVLAEQGYRPLVFERGPAIEKRIAAVQEFWNGGMFAAKSNVQFGEGGAGTFSDGKLTTRISDNRCAYVLKRFAEFGAPPEIMKKAKPHIGTDLLRGVVRNMRERILACGGKILFDTQVTGLVLKNQQVVSVTTNQGDFSVGGLILAIGHSARDTFQMLAAQGIAMEAKPFSVGVRIEHLQAEIDKALYGSFAGHPVLPPGEYQLSYREGERGVYTFCMCPGGFVVPSASEENTIVTNGMSEFARNGRNANAAVVVSVTPDDFGSRPLDGVAFQRELEQRAFQMTVNTYAAPAQDAESFLTGKPGFRIGNINPTYARGVKAGDFAGLFPETVTKMLQNGLRQFGRKLPGYAAADAILTGPETRTSSPVRILRGETCEAVGFRRLYPCGEGAGYAGGIMSAAVDGIRVAQELMKQFAPQDLS